MGNTRHILRPSSVGILFLCVSLGCGPVAGPDKTAAGLLLGAGWGAGAGAIIGNQFDHSGPGIAIGAGFGAANGMLTGIGLDLAEGTELAQQRELDALKVQLAANQRSLMMLQDSLDLRDRKLTTSSIAPQIFFDHQRASLRSGSVAQLERLADAIKSNPYVGRIELHGHTDNSGNVEENMRLSEARARSVATFLANHGVPLDSMSIVAHGAERPLASNDTESGKQLNRRVEVVLLK